MYKVEHPRDILTNPLKQKLEIPRKPNHKFIQGPLLGIL